VPGSTQTKRFEYGFPHVLAPAGDQMGDVNLAEFTAQQVLYAVGPATDDPW
jgi:hypothetical protein